MWYTIRQAHAVFAKSGPRDEIPQSLMRLNCSLACPGNLFADRVRSGQLHLQPRSETESSSSPAAINCLPYELPHESIAPVSIPPAGYRSTQSWFFENPSLRIPSTPLSRCIFTQPFLHCQFDTFTGRPKWQKLSLA